MTLDKPNKCHACRFSYLEPSGPPNLTCGHPDTGLLFGQYVHSAMKLDGHCGPERVKFEQHPHRDEEGNLVKT